MKKKYRFTKGMPVMVTYNAADGDCGSFSGKAYFSRHLRKGLCHKAFDWCLDEEPHVLVCMHNIGSREDCFPTRCVKPIKKKK